MMSGHEMDGTDRGITREEQWRLHQLVARCRRGLEALLDRELRPVGISAIELGILDSLSEAKGSDGPTTPADLAVKVTRRHNSVVSTLLNMERAGLVSLRRKSPVRRTMEVEMTARGDKVYAEALNAVRVVGDIMSALDRKQRHQLIALLDILDQALAETLDRTS